MAPTDLTIEILTSIRDEVRTTNVRLDQMTGHLSERIDATNGRLDRLEQRHVETEIRLATELVAVAGAVNGLRDDLRQDRALRERVDAHERRIEALEERIG